MVRTRGIYLTLITLQGDQGHFSTSQMIGLGGGSLAKACYRCLPDCDITVVEIDPKVIALRDAFHVPPDDARFRIVCADGVDYVALAAGSPDVLLLDGFDARGLPDALSEPVFPPSIQTLHKTVRTQLRRDVVDYDAKARRIEPELRR